MLTAVFNICEPFTIILQILFCIIFRKVPLPLFSPSLTVRIISGTQFTPSSWRIANVNQCFAKGHFVPLWDSNREPQPIAIYNPVTYPLDRAFSCHPNPNSLQKIVLHHSGIRQVSWLYSRTDTFLSNVWELVKRESRISWHFPYSKMSNTSLPTGIHI